MLLQFKLVSDESIWVADVATMQFARVSAPASDPESKVLESGRLVPQGFGVYLLEGRPKEKAVLSSIGNYVVAIGTTVKIFLRANVAIKDFTMPVPIRQVLYEILPTDPQQIQNSIQEVANAGQNSEQESTGAQEPASGGIVSGEQLQEESASAPAEIQSGDETVGTDSPSVEISS